MDVETTHQPGTMPNGVPYGKFQPKRHQTQDRASQSCRRIGQYLQSLPYHGVFQGYFYRYQAARDAGGVEALFEVSRRKPNLKNRVEEATEQAVVEFAMAFPAYGQVRASNELCKQVIFVSPSGVRSIWLRHSLAPMKQRLAALEKISAEQGLVLTEAQVQALERKKQDDEASEEIESHHPGYLGSQDTFYVGTIKGVGRIYQQTFVDIYSKWATAKLYTTKTPITGADLLNDRVLPFFASQQMGVIRILTDRGTEYCGKLETHDYQLYLGVNSIEHTRTRRVIRRPTASANASIRPFFMSFIRLHSGANYTIPWRSFRPIWISGLNTTIPREHIKVKCVAAGLPCKPFLRGKTSGTKRSDSLTNRTGKSVKTDSTVRSSLNYYTSLAIYNYT